MITREQKIRVGFFFLAGILLMAVLLAASLGKALFQKEKIYYIQFKDTSVNGLEVGSTVKYRGINIGTVDDISVSKEDISNIIVTISVAEETPIKEDMKANLVMMGITGMKQIELYGGTNVSKPLPPGSKIPPGSSALADITGDAKILADKAELLLNNLNGFTRKENQEAFRGILTKIDFILEENSQEITTILKSTAVITEDLSRTTDDLEIAMEELRKLTETGKLETLTDELIGLTENLNTQTAQWGKSLPPERLTAISRNIEEFTAALKASRTTELLAETESAIREMKTILEQAGKTSETVDMAVLRSSRDIVRAIETLNETLTNLNEFSRVISDDPSRLINF